MKQFKFLTMAALALTIGFTSCSSDDEGANGGNPINGKDTYMKLVISQPNVPGTYATADPNATVNEAKITYVGVILVKGSTLEKAVNVPVADFEQTANGNNDLYTMKAAKEISCKTGKTSVYVVMNVSDTKLAQIASLVDFNQTVPAVMSELVDLSGKGIVMAGTEVRTTTLVEKTDGAYSTSNTVKLAVQRMVAKIALQRDENITLDAAGGTFSNMEFAVATVNKKTSYLQQWDGNIVKDANWTNGSFVATDFDFAYNTTNPTDYKAINAVGVAANELTAVYAPENTSQAHLQQEVTCAIVRTKYQPGTIKVYTNGVNATGGFKDQANGALAGTTFWTVALAGGARQYFITEAVANDYAAANAGSVKSAPYTNGLCYYRVYLNAPGKAMKHTIDGSNNLVSSIVTSSPYDVIRNAFYKVNITKIVAPGNPTAEPVDPPAPVAVPTDILVNVEAIAWDMRSQDTELTPM